MTAVPATPMAPDASSSDAPADSVPTGWAEADAPLADWDSRGRPADLAGPLASDTALNAYGEERAILFRDRLGIAPCLFKGLSMAHVSANSLAFAHADAAALIFARWGAKISLLGADEARQQRVAEAFSRFGHEEPVFESINGASATGRYDWINAEMVLNGQRAVQDVLGDLKPLLGRDGLVHLSYFSRRGTFIEAMIRALIAGVTASSGKPPAETARSLMMSKWDGRGSARAFEAWIEGHLINPAARGLNPLDSGDLCRRAVALGLRLQSSTPAYRDALVSGHPTEPIAAVEDIRRIDEHLSRSALGHALGLPLYYGGNLGGAGEIGALIDAAIGACEDCCERAEPARFKAAAAALRALNSLTRQCSMWVGRSGAEAAGSFLSGLSQAFDAVAVGDTGSVEVFCRENASFRELWGTPIHHALFRRDETLEATTHIDAYPEDRTPGRPRPR